MKEISENEISNAMDVAYMEAGHNAYFGNGFKAGIEFFKAYQESTNNLIPLTEMSGDHFSQIFTVGFAPSFIKTIVNTFKSLHGFHNAIAMYGHFKSHRVAVVLGYDVEFTISEQQGSELSRARGVRERLDALKRGNFGVAWTGARLTMNEYLEGADLFDTELEKLLKGVETDKSENRLYNVQKAYDNFKMRRPI